MEITRMFYTKSQVQYITKCYKHLKTKQPAMIRFEYQHAVSRMTGIH